MSKKQLVIQFAKAPVVGNVKTRLIPDLGGERACQLHWLMVEELCQRLAHREAQHPWHYQLHVDEVNNKAVQELSGRYAIEVVEQSDGDLGMRMSKAFASCLTQYHKVVLIGSDCLSVNDERIALMFDAVDGSDISLLPALDGGYAAVGMKDLQASIFSEIDWGSSRVFSQTVAKCNADKISFECLEPVRDIDSFDDLRQSTEFELVRRFLAVEEGQLSGR